VSARMSKNSEVRPNPIASCKNFGEKGVDEHDIYKGEEAAARKCAHEAKPERGEDGKVQNLINPAEHEPVFVVFGAGLEEHICKKCPINGQNLTKYV